VAANSHIEWTEATWKPVTGCTKVSAGCKNCYAERLALRLQEMGNVRYRGGFKVTLHKDLIDLPKRWREPRLIFVNSMSDLFHEEVPLEFIQNVVATMEECPKHTFRILTKRSSRLRKLASQLAWPANVWIGVSVEDSRVLSRIDDLRMVPAAVRFLSCEPADLFTPGDRLIRHSLGHCRWRIQMGRSTYEKRMDSRNLSSVSKSKCSIFFKQWGGVRKHAIGRQLNGKTYDEMPQRVAA
jgi:protein gp37